MESYPRATVDNAAISRRKWCEVDVDVNGTNGDVRKFGKKLFAGTPARHTSITYGSHLALGIDFKEKYRVIHSEGLPLLTSTTYTYVNK